MRRDVFYVEGEADKKFLSDMIAQFVPHYELNPKQIIETSGWTNLSKSAPRFKEAADDGAKNIVLFDADTDYATRAQEISVQIPAGVNYDLFLFPDNKSKGNLESLLLQIINQAHRKVLDCFDNYHNCLASSGSYTLPDSKVKIFAYLSALLEERLAKKAKEPNRDYRNIEHWNLSHQALNPLSGFLIQHCR